MMLWLTLAWGAQLSGTVATPGGDPVPSSIVLAYDERLQYAWALTEPDGSWQIRDLVPGPYRVRVLPPNSVNRMETWAGAGLDMCEAEVVTLNGSARVDVITKKGAVLQGQVTDPSGQPLAGVQVSARSQGGVFPSQRRVATSDLFGVWTLQGLPPDQGDVGVYSIKLEDPVWPDQFLPGVYSEDEAERYTLSAGDHVSTGTLSLRLGIDVVGEVNGPEGPVSDGLAHVFSGNQIRTTSISAGHYQALGLPPGEVLVWAVADGLATTYYPDADRPDERLLGAEDDIVQANLELPAASRMVGRLLGAGDLSGVSLLLYNSDNTVGVGGEVDADGSYLIDGLHPGAYTLVIYGADEGYVSDFVRDETGEKVVFDVPIGDLSLDLPLPSGARIEGQVTDRYTGAPIYGAFVELQSADGSIEVATSDRDGRYRLAGLVAGSWHPWSEYYAYCANDPGWVTRYYPDQRNPDLGGDIVLSAGQVVQWDISLEPDADHDGMDDVWEVDNGLDPSRDDAAEDPDGDGFSNLEEYLLGTDPMAVASAEGCGCGGRGGRGGLLFLPVWLLLRRKGVAFWWFGGYPGPDHTWRRS